MGKKTQLREAKAEATKLKQERMRFPYILYACLSIYNQLYLEPSRKDITYFDAFTYEESVGNMMDTAYVGDIRLSYDTLKLQSATGIFWFQISV